MIGKPNCSDCGKPREAAATSYSYCIECGRQRQRDAYANRMAAAGRFVVPRINKKPRAEQLRDQRFKPGICEMCSTQVESLQILYEKPDPRVVATAAEDDFLAVMPTVTAVICKLCADLIKRFPEEDWTRFLRIAHYLGKRNLTRADIITE